VSQFSPCQRMPVPRAHLAMNLLRNVLKSPTYWASFVPLLFTLGFQAHHRFHQFTHYHFPVPARWHTKRSDDRDAFASPRRPISTRPIWVSSKLTGWPRVRITPVVAGTPGLSRTRSLPACRRSSTTNAPQGPLVGGAFRDMQSYRTGGCVVYRAALRPYRPAAERLWRAQSFAIRWPTDIQVIAAGRGQHRNRIPCQCISHRSIEGSHKTPLTRSPWQSLPMRAPVK
jgi:hypothetical protein